MFIHHSHQFGRRLSCTAEREGTSLLVPSKLQENLALAAGDENMAKPPKDRTSFSSHTYFVTASTWGHRSLFQTERMAKVFLGTLAHYRNEGKYSLHEFVLMPDHFHLLLTPSLGVILERAMQFIKGGFSYRVGKELERKMEIWERGYVDHRIRDRTDFANHVEYIRENPVKAGLAGAPADYPYSSAFAGFDLDSIPQGLKPEPSSAA